jgi:hypothetical protein
VEAASDDDENEDGGQDKPCPDQERQSCGEES